MAETSIFISHRHEDASLAKFIKEKLLEISSKKLSMFISEEISGGKKWRDNIISTLDSADFLILIYSDPGEDWSWCFYEVGYFDARIREKTDGRILCLLPPKVPVPSPIGHLQQRSSTEDIASDLENILNPVCESQPIEIRALASEIVRRIRTAKLSGIRRITMEFDNIDEIQQEYLPIDARIVSDPSTIQAIFGFADDITWGNILQMANRSDDTQQPYDHRWIREITSVINQAMEGVIRSPQCVLFSRNGDLRYRFVFSHVRRSAEGKLSCEFVVCEDVSGPARNLPASLLSLVTSIRMGIRVRHEVLGIARYQRIRESQIEREDLSQIRTSLFNILTEAETRGSMDFENLLSAFDDPNARTRVETMNLVWPELAEGIGIDIETLRKSSYVVRRLTHLAGSRQLEDEELVEFRDSYEKIYWMNKEFLSIACRRLGEMFVLTEAEKDKCRKINRPPSDDPSS